jgi:DNA-3-methyladenine glycosylase
MGAPQYQEAQVTPSQKSTRPLPLSFYRRCDPVAIARELIGKWIFTDFKNRLTGGIIIETEAYGGAKDRASHAYANRRTKRTRVLFERGGVAYVHLCYGMHHLLNIVVNEKETPEGILIRAIAPRIGIEAMRERRFGTRCKTPKQRELASGPGLICQALGITLDQYGHLMNASPLWIEDRKTEIHAKNIRATPRIGIDYAGDDAHLPWRFLLENPDEIH